ncbi:MAG: hypothetical protein ACLFUV_00735 [Methanomassiliicoccales archaeon]
MRWIRILAVLGEIGVCLVPGVILLIIYLVLSRRSELDAAAGI